MAVRLVTLVCGAPKYISRSRYSREWIMVPASRHRHSNLVHLLEMQRQGNAKSSLVVRRRRASRLLLHRGTLSWRYLARIRHGQINIDDRNDRSTPGQLWDSPNMTTPFPCTEYCGARWDRDVVLIQTRCLSFAYYGSRGPVRLRLSIWHHHLSTRALENHQLIPIESGLLDGL